jgi:hypothetical protein
MNRKQKERVEKERLKDEEDAKKAAQSKDPGKYTSTGFTRLLRTIMDFYIIF